MKTIQERLRDACNGKPAKIQWPHRLLHEAADALDSADALHMVAVEFVNDWKKGEFELPKLAKCDADTISLRCEDYRRGKRKEEMSESNKPLVPSEAKLKAIDLSWLWIAEALHHRTRAESAERELAAVKQENEKLRKVVEAAKRVSDYNTIKEPEKNFISPHGNRTLH